MPPGDRDEATLGDVRRRAMDLLARREHSALELRRKLHSRGYPVELIEEAVRGLAEEGLQSDERFAESFINGRIGKGQGPVRIRTELVAQGVAETLAEDLLARTEIDWLELARTVWRKRFGGRRPEDFKERARQARFLQYRGFTSDQAISAIGRSD